MEPGRERKEPTGLQDLIDEVSDAIQKLDNKLSDMQSETWRREAIAKLDLKRESLVWRLAVLRNSMDTIRTQGYLLEQMQLSFDAATVGGDRVQTSIVLSQARPMPERQPGVALAVIPPAVTVEVKKPAKRRRVASGASTVPTHSRKKREMVAQA